jgi:hypothetical protein
MLGTIIGLLGLSLGSATFSYELWNQHRILGYFLAGLAAIVGISAPVIFISEPLKTFLKARSVSSRRIELSGPLNLPTILWSANTVMAAGLLVTLLVQTRLDRFYEQQSEFLRETNEVLLQQKELIRSMTQLESKLPANFSVADAIFLKKALHHPRFRIEFRIYRVLDEHINRLTDELTDILKGSGWVEKNPPTTPPNNMVVLPGLNVQACLGDTSYIDAAYLVNELSVINVHSKLEEGHECGTIVITLAESR